MVENHRVLARPAWSGFRGRIERVSYLPKETMEELEQFFMNTSFLTLKKLRITGWRGPRAARGLIRRLRI